MADRVFTLGGIQVTQRQTPSTPLDDDYPCARCVFTPSTCARAEEQRASGAVNCADAPGYHYIRFNGDAS